MTQQSKDTFNVLIKYVPLLGFIMTIFYLGAWSRGLDDRTFTDAAQKANVMNHIDKDNGIHLSLQTQQTLFVTRNEYKLSLEAINEKLDLILENKNKKKTTVFEN